MSAFVPGDYPYNGEIFGFEWPVTTVGEDVFGLRIYFDVYLPASLFDFIADRYFLANDEHGNPVFFYIPDLLPDGTGNLISLHNTDWLNKLILQIGLTLALLIVHGLVQHIPKKGTMGGSLTPVGSGEGPIYITNAIDVAAGVGLAIGSAVSSALSSAFGDINKIIGGLGTSIGGSIGVLSAALGGVISQLFGGIGDSIGKILGGIGTAIGGALSTVFSGITGVLGGIKDAITGLWNTIETHFTDLIAAIKANGVSAIIPVIQLIAQEAYNIRNIIAAIQLDLHAGIGALLLLPIQLTSSLGSIDATLMRTLQGLTSPPGVYTQSTVTLGDAPIPPLLGASISNLISPNSPPNTFATVLTDLSGFLGACDHTSSITAIQQLHDKILGLPDWLQWIYWLGLDIVSTLTTTGGLLKRQIDLSIEDANKLCPITKLDPTTAVQANLRGFLDDGTLREEIGVQGYAPQRIDVLRKLATQRLDAGISIDSWYRGIISESDLGNNLAVLGFTASQIETIKTQSLALPTPSDVLRWFDYQAVDEPTLDTLLKILRYTPEQIKLIKQTYQTSETVAQQINLHGRLEAIGAGYIPVTSAQPTPQEVLDAARRAQITPGNARLQWLAHFALPNYVTVTQSYFQGMRPLDDVHRAMADQNIPEEFWDELVALLRPLIPFRSITALIKAGVMSEADAIIELSKHGFDPLHIKWLVDYANKQTAPKASSAAASASILSIATAKQLFNDGVFTRDQYKQILIEHKLPPDVAELTVEADEIAQNTKLRKQEIADLVNEVLAGLLTVDDALSQLHQAGFSMGEIAKFQKEIRRARTATARHPSIGEMKTFIKAGYLTLDAFRNELQIQGWADPWLTAFVKLETPPTGTGTGIG